MSEYPGVQYFKEIDGYYAEDGTHYDTAEDFLHTHVFGFCGCDSPQENLRYIRDGLAHIARLTSDERKSAEWSVWSAAWLVEGLTLFGNAASRQFFFYWADSEDLTEHGSRIPGWLTDKGRQILHDLNAILAHDALLKDSQDA